MTASYGARTIKPITDPKRYRRTHAKLEALDQAIIDELAQDHPQSVRHVFYRLINPRLPAHVEKSEKGYRDVQHRCVALRRSGRIPYGYITDATRRGYFVPTFAGGRDFVLRMQEFYRSDLWARSHVRAEVWVESSVIAAVVQPVCEALAVSLWPARGFSSLTFTYEAAKAMNDADDGRPVVIFYIGDWDPAGVLIDVKIEQALRRHLDPGIELHFIRLGITAEQVVDYDLPTKERSPRERRKPGMQETVQAVAMPPRILRQLLEVELQALLPAGELKTVQLIEREERAGLRRFAEMYAWRDGDA